ncbi:hypothetical protein GQ457_13G029970 [Hibiscus cannabinus]
MKSLHHFPLLFLVFSLALATCSSADSHEDFLDCLSSYHPEESSSISRVVYTERNSSYSTTVRCSKRHGLQIRTRSGGHDFEGLSYVSDVPFVVVDLFQIRSVDVDVENREAWVQSGAITVEEVTVYCSENTDSRGDNVIDARLVDVNGRVLDRRSMGEDLFWAIRGGGGGSFGIVLSWKVKLVPIPSTVTVFTVGRTLEQNATQLLHRWQYVAPNLPNDVYSLISISTTNSTETGNRTVLVTFISVFQGSANELMPLMQERFPELGLVRENLIEMTWIESIIFLNRLPNETPEILLNRTYRNTLLSPAFKAKSDYVRKPMPEIALQGLWSQLLEDVATTATMNIVSFGGEMDEIPESALPFPHRKGTLYGIDYNIGWGEEENNNSQRYIVWIRKVYRYMGAFVSKSPREAYVNYRDLDIGRNNDDGKTSYTQASVWGRKYFNKNFDSHEDFLDCLSSYHPEESSSISRVVYTERNSSYSAILESSIQNRRFSTPSTLKPLVIVTPLNTSHVQTTVHCSKRHGLQIRTRSGGHDFEGLSYVSDVPFVVVDLSQFRSIDVDVENREAWVQSVGRTLEQNATQLLHRCWQYVAPNLPNDAYSVVSISTMNSTETGNRTVLATFISVFQGSANELMPLMQERFPELGLVRENLIEMTWIESLIFLTQLPNETPEILLNRTYRNALLFPAFKAKSDYVRETDAGNRITRLMVPTFRGRSHHGNNEHHFLRWQNGRNPGERASIPASERHIIQDKLQHWVARGGEQHNLKDINKSKIQLNIKSPTFPFPTCFSFTFILVMKMKEMKERMERLVVLPFNPPAVLLRQVLRSEKSPEETNYSKSNSGIQSLVRITVKIYKEIEEVTAEMEIGYPTDVKHVTHIGLDGTTTTTTSSNNPLKGWQDFSPTDHNFVAFPSISLRQFGLAMAAQTQTRPLIH